MPSLSVGYPIQFGSKVSIHCTGAGRVTDSRDRTQWWVAWIRGKGRVLDKRLEHPSTLHAAPTGEGFRHQQTWGQGDCKPSTPNGPARTGLAHCSYALRAQSRADCEAPRASRKWLPGQESRIPGCAFLPGSYRTKPR